MQRKEKRAGRPAQRMLAGILAVLLLAFGLVAASGHLHQSAHHGGDGASASCVICLFAHGQVDLFGAAPALVSTVVLLLCGVALSVGVLSGRVDFLSPPGRAPPALSYNS